MASALRSKISQAASRASNGSSAEATQSEQDQYRLFVTAGPSYDLSTHKTVAVNTETPTYIENQFLRAKIQVRIRGFRGLPSSSPPESAYFNDPIHKSDQYSVGFSFVPKIDIPSQDTVWGNDLDHPIRERLPPGFNTAFRIVKEFIDPGLACDVYADEPWLYGPSLSCWFALRIGDVVADGDDFDAPGVLVEGADGRGKDVREKLGLPEHNEKRRKFFLRAENREEFVFEKGRLYQADFYNPYLDFANYALKLPGFSLKVTKYIGDKTHVLRYVFKERNRGDVFFNVNITLLWGEKLERALKETEVQQQQTGGEAEGSLVGIVSGNEGESNGLKQEGVSQDVVAGAEGGSSGLQNGTSHGVQAPHDEEKDESSGEALHQEQSNSAPDQMQLHPGDHTAAAASGDAAEVSEERVGRMHIHPGDHTAAADDATNKMKDDAVDEIDRLLCETSTKQERDDIDLAEVHVVE